jgi:hypothetical protein
MSDFDAKDFNEDLTTCSTFWLDLATGATTQLPADLLILEQRSDGSEEPLVRLQSKTQQPTWGLDSDDYDEVSEDDEPERCERCYDKYYYRNYYNEDHRLFTRCAAVTSVLSCPS